MFPATDEQFEAFIKTKTVDTRFFSFYEDQRLIAVSVVDLLEQGLSAVYTFLSRICIKDRWETLSFLANQ